MTAREALQREWDLFMLDIGDPAKRGTWSQDQRWRADNPGELAMLLGYRAGGPRPSAVTVTGRRMVEHIAAWLALEPDPIAWPPREVEPPPWSPLRTLTVSGLAEWGRIYPTIRNGDRLLVNDCTFDRQLDLSPAIDGIAEIRFAPDVRMMGDPTPHLNAAWLKPRGILRVFGGTLSNPKGHGLLVYDSSGCGWWDFTVDGVGGSGVRVFGPNGHVDDLTLLGSVTDIGSYVQIDPTIDPHEDKGSGLHAAYVGGAGYPVRNGKVAIEATECATGSIQVGQSDGCRFWIRARDLTYEEKPPRFQTGGNAFQPFGLVRNAEAWIVAENVARGCDPRWLASGSSVRVSYGRVVGARKEAWVPSPMVTYVDCEPTP